MAAWFSGWGGHQAAPMPAGTLPLVHDLSMVKEESLRQPGGYATGDLVEYFSATSKSWIPAKVLTANATGTFTLDCKPDVAADKIRWPVSQGDSAGKAGSTAQAPAVPSSTSYCVGDLVEYFSASTQTWIPAKVEKVNPSGTYNLDCKPEVTPDKMRPRGGSGTLGSSTWGGSASSKQPVSAGMGTQVLSHTAGKYAAGDLVEYFAASTQAWIPAKVEKANPSGTYNLDCKLDVSTDRIRPRGNSGGAYAAGDLVEYFSATQADWIPAKVLTVSSQGTYNLDCKPEVPADKIRPRQQSSTAPAGGSSNWSLFPAAIQSLGSSSGAAVGSHFASSSSGAPVQLLRVRRNGSKWHYEVCSEGASFLERHGSRRIAVTSMCGLPSTGKSYLFNVLLERMQRGHPGFQVGGPAQMCTQGLWLWGSADEDDQNSPLLAFLDCEGFGSNSSDKVKDAQLLALCTVLSSVVMLNTKGALNESLFSALATACQFATHIEERGQEANKPALLWVLRDFMVDLRDANGRPTSADEYLEQALFAPSHGGRPGARDVRQTLLRFFSHRSCVTLPRPVVEEAQLQQLNTMQYSRLRGEFRSGVEAMRGQMMSSTAANPKTVGGHPLGCYGFVALLRQLASALNDSKTMNVKGAWEHVQHTACGGLAEELRTDACSKLRSLASGAALPGGAQLPLAEDSLRTVLRDQRHRVKEEWESRAVGDENVRKEYWQELKESLAREERVVQQANGRLGDQKLMDSLKGWQSWLDDDASSWTTCEEMITEFGKLSDRMPSAPLSRASRAAMESAGRRVVAVRHALEATKKQSDEERTKALAWGEDALQKEGLARNELQDRLQRLEQAEARLGETEQSHNHTKEELQARQKELDMAKAQYEDQMKQIEEVHGSTRAELEKKLAEIQLERDQLADDLKQTQQSHQTARFELESRSVELQDSKSNLEKLMVEMEAARSREQEAKGQLRTLGEKEASLRSSLEELRGTAAKDNADRLASERLARAAADTAASERRKLEVDLEQARADLEQLRAQLNSERDNLRNENEKTRAEHVRMVEETRRKLDDERKLHIDSMHEEKNRLIDRERTAGVLEGQVQALSAQNTLLREQLAESKEQVRELERSKTEHKQERENLQKHLEEAKAAHDEQMKIKEADHEKLLEERRKESEKREQKKCTNCVVM